MPEIIPTPVASLPVIEYQGQRVITLAMMDAVHGRPEGTARRNFNANGRRLKEGCHYCVLRQADEIRSVGLARQDGSTPASVTVLMERGYLVLVKSFTDDLAWQVQEMYRRLVAAMPECVVLAQVALSSLVGIKERSHWRQWFNRISQKSVDFVLCLPHDFMVVAVVELDDMSHTRPDRVRADTAKDVALRVAGHPILRFRRHDMPSAEEIRLAVAGPVPGASRVAAGASS